MYFRACGLIFEDVLYISISSLRKGILKQKQTKKKLPKDNSYYLRNDSKYKLILATSQQLIPKDVFSVYVNNVMLNDSFVFRK